MPDICRLCFKKEQDVLCDLFAEIIDEYLKKKKCFLREKIKFATVESKI
jgi:hypothetical protein